MTPQEMKEKRLSLHLSQPALAARLGFSAAHVRNVENGHTVLPDAVMELYNDALVEGYKPTITADEIRHLRQERGLSREELDEALGFPHGYVRLLEIGKRYATPGLVERIKKIGSKEKMEGFKEQA